METGFATRIMRLSASAAMATSPCRAGKPRARSFAPMNECLVASDRGSARLRRPGGGYVTGQTVHVNAGAFLT